MILLDPGCIFTTEGILELFPKSFFGPCCFISESMTVDAALPTARLVERPPADHQRTTDRQEFQLPLRKYIKHHGRKERTINKIANISEVGVLQGLDPTLNGFNQTILPSFLRGKIRNNIRCLWIEVVDDSLCIAKDSYWIWVDPCP